MLFPEIKTVKDLAKSYKTIPVFYELLVDQFTPIRLFNCLHERYKNCFILESVDNKDQWGRYSYVGIDPKEEIIINGKNAMIKCSDGTQYEGEINEPRDFLQSIIDEHRSPKINGYPKLTGGLIGYFAYDCIRYFEKTLTSPPKDDLNMADINLHLFDELVAYDHLSNKAVIILNISAEGSIDEQYEKCERRAEEIAEILRSYTPAVKEKKSRPSELKITSNITKEQYLENVKRAKEYIREGDIFQVVPSQRFEVEDPPESFDVYRMLRTTNPSPYLYYFDHDDYAIAGASPEMLVSVNNGVIVNKPIAGTIKRGLTNEEDKANELTLLNDPKERAEHTMLVDLGRNDVGKVSRFGSVKVDEYMSVERYSKVMHLVSTVKGELAENKRPIDALMALLPAGTLSGAPKVRAMEIIDELETTKRGLYGGTVGYLAFDGSIDTCIAIRTVLFKNGKAYVQAGGGVVADSDPEKEYEESVNKATAVINAIKEANKL